MDLISQCEDLVCRYEQEAWKDIVGYDGRYQISNNGNVRSVDMIVHGKEDYFQKGRILKQSSNGRYKIVMLMKDGSGKMVFIHRLVAEYFVQNPNGCNVVNHIDENTYNNHYKNLEWCTQKYNANYGKRNEKISISHQMRRSNAKKGGLEE